MDDFKMIDLLDKIPDNVYRCIHHTQVETDMATGNKIPVLVMKDGSKIDMSNWANLDRWKETSEWFKGIDEWLKNRWKQCEHGYVEPTVADIHKMAIKVLKSFTAWRRNASDEPSECEYDSATIGEAIDYAVKFMEDNCKEV